MKKTVFFAALSLMSVAAFANYPVHKPVPHGAVPSVLKPSLPGNHVSKAPSTTDWEYITNPEGRVEIMCGNYSCLIAGQYVFDNLAPCKFVYADDNVVYIQNPVSGYRNDAFVKGVLEGNRIRVDFPQAIGEYFGEVLLIQRMYVDDRGQFAVVDKDENFVEYIIEEDGSISLDLPGSKDSLEGVSQYIGMTYEDYEFAYHADFYQHFDEIKFEGYSLPEGLEYQPYKMTDQYYPQGCACFLAFDGDDAYLTGIFPNYPEYFIKGKRDGERLVFEAPQYQGIFRKHSAFVWITALDEKDEMMQSFVLEYDKNKKDIYTPGEIEIFLNNDYRKISYMDYLVQPDFTYQTYEQMNANPVKPQVSMYRDFNEMLGYGGIQWDFSPLNVNGYAFDTTRLYFNVYLDDEQLPAVINGEEVYDIPVLSRYESDTYDIVGYYDHVDNFFYYPATKYGFQIFYKGTDGVTYTSGKVEAVLEANNGVDTVAGEPAVSVEYTDLAGRKVMNPKTGLFIKTTTFESGRRLSEKVIIK